MAHMLSFNTAGNAEMAYAGETPWHGLGQQLEAGATIEQWIEAAGMGWKINRSRVKYGDETRFEIMENRHVLFRSDTKKALGIVSPQFKIVQPREILEFFRDLVGANGFTLETAGVLFGGQRFWALANIGESRIVGKRDKVGGRVLISTGCDGTIATTAEFTTHRPVCWNTLSVALKVGSDNRIKIGHRSEFDAQAVKNQMGLAPAKFHEFMDSMEALAKMKVSEADAKVLTAELIAPKEMASAQGVSEKTLESKPFQKIMALFGGEGKGSNLDSAEGTAWGWVNAVTEFVDHHARAHNADNRMDSAFFGKGNTLKTRAVELATAL